MRTILAIVFVVAFLSFFTSCENSPKCMDETNGVILTQEEMDAQKELQEIIDIYALEDSIGEKLHKWGDKWVRESELDSIIEIETQYILDSIYETLYE